MSPRQKTAAHRYRTPTAPSAAIGRPVEDQWSGPPGLRLPGAKTKAGPKNWTSIRGASRQACRVGCRADSRKAETTLGPAGVAACATRPRHVLHGLSRAAGPSDRPGGPPHARQPAREDPGGTIPRIGDNAVPRFRYLIPVLLALTSFAGGQIKDKKPVFGGACRLCPWGAMAEVVQSAMKPYGYDVQICYNCNAVDAPRIVSEARMPPAYRPDPAVPEILAPRNAPGLGPIDFRRHRDPVPTQRLPRGRALTRRTNPGRICA